MKAPILAFPAFLLAVLSSPALAQATNWDPGAFDHAQSMLRARLGPDTILIDLERRFRQSPGQITGILVALRVSPDAFTADLARRYRASPTDVAGWLRAASADPAEVLPALAGIARPPDAGLVAMREARFTARDGIDGLNGMKRVASDEASADETVTRLEVAGWQALDALYAWAEFARGEWPDSRWDDPDWFADRLRRKRASQQDIVDALRVLEHSSEEIAGALRRTYDDLPETRDPAGFGRMLRDVGFSARDVAAALVEAFNGTMEDLAAWMQRVGYSATETAEQVIAFFGGTAEELADVLRKAGYRAGEIADALVRWFNSTAAPIAGYLQHVGFSAAEVADALRTRFSTPVSQAAAFLLQAGFPAMDVAEALKDAYGLTADAIVAALLEAGVPLSEILDVLHDMGLTAAEAVAAMNDAGVTIEMYNQIIDRIMQVYQLTREAVLQLIGDG